MAVEPPFALVLGGQVVRGRIDAVYREPTTAATWSSTGRPTGPQTADPLQLAVYRVAWAELTGCRSSGSARRSTTSAPATSSSTTTCPTGRLEELEALRRGRADVTRDHGSRRASAQPRVASIASRAISTMSPKVSSRSCAVVSSPVTMWSETVQIASARRW